jgi:2,4-diaminopentanoate dehydrogenase
MPYRVIQWATGNVGQAAVRGIVAHPELELVGAWVHSPKKAGRDVGELCGLPPLGVEATNDIDAVLAMDADCVVYAPQMADTDMVIRLLAAGKNVVTPVGWFYASGLPRRSEIEAACTQGSATLHGIHPGGITERFPLMLSAMCTNIRHVLAEEFSDIRNYAAPFVVREIMQFGKPPEVARNSPMAELLGAGFMQSIDMIADTLGFTLDPAKRTQHEVAVATRPIETPVGPIDTGTVAAQRFTWDGTVAGRPVITARTNWFMGEADFDPPWRLGGERFEVHFEADPPLHVTFAGLHPERVGVGLDRNPGLLATAMHCVNAIPYVCAAPPGIRSYLDLPLIAGRAGLT